MSKIKMSLAGPLRVISPSHNRTLPMRASSTLRTITHNRISSINHPQLFYLRTTMADDEPNKIITSQSDGDKSSPEEEKDKVPEKAPPPPEKPFPDDCCGSGCVRCVWDIYYDELEAYNKLVKEK